MAKKRSRKRAPTRTYTVYIIELSRDCVRKPCALAPLYVGQTAHDPEHPLRPAQSGWEAGFGDAPQIREEAAVGLDEGDWHALNAKGRGGDGEGGGGGAGEKGASGVLGMSLLSWRNRRPRPAILFEGGLPSRTRFKNGEALNCLSILRSPCIHSLRSVSLTASVSILSLLIVDPHRVRCAACGLGRKLKPEEVRHFANTARRVAAALQTTRNR